MASKRPYDGPDPWTIRQTRKMLELTQAQFAAEVGVQRVQVSLWETGKSRPSGPARKMIQEIQRRLLFGHPV